MTEESKSSDVRMLRALLDPDLARRRVWHAEDLEAILQHQWDAPLQADLGELPPTEAQDLRLLCEAHGLLLKSYGDLFGHSMPPLEILRPIKEYAKRNMACPDEGLPLEIAELLYVLSVVVARLRHNARITGQKDETVCKNIESVLGQPWITSPVADLLREGLRALGGRTDADEGVRDATSGKPKTNGACP